MKCRICGEELTGRAVVEFDRMYKQFSDVKFFYKECTNCHSYCLLNIPDDLSKYYPKDYYSYCSPEELTTYKMLLAKSYMDLYKLDENSIVCDYGGGSDELMRALNFFGVGTDDGSSLRVYDAFADNKISKEGIRTQNTPITDTTFNFIISSHCLEHAPDPLPMLQDMARILKSNGRMYIAMPNPEGLAWEVFGGHNADIDAPRHINIISHKGLEILLEKIGFRIEYYNHVGHSLSVISGIKYKNGYGANDPDNMAVNEQQVHACIGFTNFTNFMKRGSAIEFLALRKD